MYIEFFFFNFHSKHKFTCRYICTGTNVYWYIIIEFVVNGVQKSPLAFVNTKTNRMYM